MITATMDTLGRTNSELSLLRAAGPPLDTWKEWDDAAFDSLNFELDLGFDTFLLATADDFMEPFAPTAATPLATPTAAWMPEPMSPPLPELSESSCMSSSESDSSVLGQEDVLELSTQLALVEPPVKRSRKRKNPETYPTASRTPTAAATIGMDKKVIGEKKTKVQHKTGAKRREPMVTPVQAEAERLYRRRYDILHEILEAWNTGGIEDMEEIADDVYDSEITMVSPDYSEGIRGVQAIMHHWSLLLDSFPDGIMEEYVIERDPANANQMCVTWIFGGTHIFPFFGFEPRHEKVTIRGKSLFTFKGDKINGMVLSWNYRDALKQIVGASTSMPTACT